MADMNTLLILLASISIISTSTLVLLRRCRRDFTSSPPLPPSPPSLPIIGHLHLLSTPLHHCLLRLSRRYGPVLLLHLGSRPTLVVSSISAIEGCLIKNDLSFANRPPFPSFKTLTYNFTAFGSTPYGPLWQRQRRTINSVIFSPAILNSLSSGIILQEVKVLLRSLLKGGGGGVDHPNSGLLRPKLSNLTMNVVMRAVSGKRCFGEDEDDVTEIGRKYRWGVEEFFRLMSVVSVGDFLPFLEWVGLGFWDRRERKRVGRKLDELVVELLEAERNRRGGSEKKDRKSTTTSNVIEAFVEMQKREGKETCTDNYLKGMILTLLLSGITPIYQQLEWTMALLLNHPEARNKATSEIDTVVGSSCLLDNSDLPSLPYLHSVIKESLRLCSIDPLLVPHESRNECTVDGFHVPSGTMLIVNAYAVNRDPEHWVDPTSFKPERFLNAQENKDFESVYFPFGIGRRICPGSGLAMRVMLMVLGSLLQCFEWERVGEELVDMSESRGFDVCMRKPLMAKYKARRAVLPLFS